MDDNIKDKYDSTAELIHHFALLKLLAMQKYESQRISFDANDYKWLVGVNHINLLKYCTTRFISEDFEQPTIMGIIVETDFINPNNIQLWKNITNDI